MYLGRSGFYDTIKDLEVDIRRELPPSSDDSLSKNILPISRIRKARDVTRMANSADTAIVEEGWGEPAAHRLISNVFSEFANNTIYHAESPVGGFAMIQRYDFEEMPRIVAAVADGGVGVRTTLSRNPRWTDDISDDQSALELAIKEGVSGIQDPHRGLGLSSVMEEMVRPRRYMIIQSGHGAIEVRKDGHSPYIETVPSIFPGTLGYATIPVEA